MPMYRQLEKAGLDNNKIKKWGLKDDVAFVMGFAKLLQLPSLVKLIEGPVFIKERNDWDTKLTPFYREREWRIVPDFRLVHGILDTVVDISTYSDPIKRNKINKKAEKFSLSVFVRNWSDIQYIILSKDAEVPDFIKEFTIICKDKGLTNDQIQILLTRVKTSERIQLDY